MRALHRAFGAGLAEFFLAEAGHDDRQFMRRQRIGVMQHRGDRQVLAADRAVDDDLHALDGGEGVDRAPIATRAIVVEDEHQIISSALRFLAWASICFLYFSRNATLSFGVSSQTPAAWPSPTPSKNVLHLVEAALIGERGIDDLRQRAGAGDAHQRPRRNQVGEIERRDRQLLCLLHHRRRADREIRLELARRQRDPFSSDARYWTRDALGLQPFAIGIGPLRSRACRADIAARRAPLSISSRATSSSEPS